MKLMLIGCALLAMGCGAAEGDAGSAPTALESICEAGRVVECPCVGGGAGVQACSEDGSTWGECACGDSPGAGGGEGAAVATPYLAKDVCELSTEPDANKACPVLYGTLSNLYGECTVPAGGYLTNCVEYTL